MASLERSAAKHPPSKARRIAALLPQIETAMAQGSTRAHIVTALLEVGIAVSPHQLSSVIARLRRQREDAAGLPPTKAKPTSTAHAEMDSRGGSDSPARQSPAAQQVPKIASVRAIPPALSIAPPANLASKFGAHDPRLLDEVMRSTPDMKALAKLAPKVHR